MGMAVLAVVLSVPFSLIAIPFGVAGAVLVAGGLFLNGSRRYVSFGSAAVFGGVLISGALGMPPAFALLSATLSMLSWETGQNAITMGEQLSRDSATQRAEIVHAAFSTLVAVIVAGLAFGVYSVASADQPTAALVLLLLGAVVLAWTLRN